MELLLVKGTASTKMNGFLFQKGMVSTGQSGFYKKNDF